MGDEFFLRFKTEMYEYRAMTREEMVTSIDSRMASSDSRERIGIPKGCGVGSKWTEMEPNGEVRIPPWLWGSFCEFKDIEEGEEE